MPNMKMRWTLMCLLWSLPFWVLAQKPTRLEGQIATETGTVQLRWDPSMLDLPETLEAPLQNGHFSFELKLQRPAQAVLVLGGQSLPVYLEPGDVQVLEQQGNPPKYTFKGTGATHSNFLQAFYTQEGSYFDTTQMYARLLAEAIDPLELDLFDARASQQQLCKTLDQGGGLSAGFKQYIESEVKYNYDRWLLAYPVRRANARKTDTEVRNLPGAFEESFDAKLLDNPQALGSRAYRDYVWYYVSYFAAKENGYLKFKDQTAALNAKCQYASTRLSGEVSTWFIAYALMQYRMGAAPGHVERWQGVMQKGERGAEYAKIVEAQMNAVAEAKAKNPDPVATQADPDDPYPFRMLGLDGKEMHLSDYKGKVVYIDFWASWCGPCRQQFPFSKELKEKVYSTVTKKQQKEIVFLYISIDQDEEAWRKAIETLGIEGEHAYSNARWRDGAGTFFQVTGIPRYMIMDKNGQIVVRDAKRPSSEGVMEDILKYL